MSALIELESVYFPTCPNQPLKMKVVVHRGGFLQYFCPKQCNDFKQSAVPLYPIIGKVLPRGGSRNFC